VKNLFRITDLRIRVQDMGIAKIDAGPKGGTIQFDTNTKVDPFTIIQLIQAMPSKFKMKQGDQVKFSIESSTAEERFGTIEDILKMLMKNPNKS